MVKYTVSLFLCSKLKPGFLLERNRYKNKMPEGTLQAILTNLTIFNQNLLASKKARMVPKENPLRKILKGFSFFAKAKLGFCDMPFN